MSAVNQKQFTHFDHVCDGKFEALGSSPIRHVNKHYSLSEVGFAFSQFTNLFVEHVENAKQLHLTFHM